MNENIEIPDMKKHKERVILYGASSLGKMAMGALEAKGYEIICFCDTDSGKWGGKLGNRRIISPEELRAMYGSEKVIISSAQIREITETLNSLGFYDVTAFRIRNEHYRDYILRMENEYKNKKIVFLGKNNLSALCAGLFGKGGERYVCEDVEDLKEYSKDTLAVICLPDYLKAFHRLMADGFFNMLNGLYYIFYKKTQAFDLFINNILFSDKSFTNQGEFGNDDLILEALFCALNIDKPKYADIGCNLPTEGNNTYIFYKKGARGQLVEPNPRLQRLIESARPDDELLPVCIGCDNAEKTEFFINTVNSGLSTFSVRDGASWERREVSSVMFNDLIDKDVQLVSLDVEGLDYEILKTIDFSLFEHLAVICAETNAAVEYMSDKGFRLFAKNYTNSIFVKDTLFDKILKDRLCREIYYGYACLDLIRRTCF